MLRRFLRHPRTQAFLAWLLGAYLAFVYRTTRWTMIGGEHYRAAVEVAPGQRRGAIYAFWHERLAMMPMLPRLGRQHAPLQGMGTHVLVSRHRDGRFIGEVVKRFDLQMVYASSSKGGAAGVRELLRMLRAEQAIAITPDGPRGPRREAKPGVAQLAVLSGCAVLPTAARTSRGKVLGSWDRMIIPMPFARGVVTVGPPIMVPRGSDAAAALAQIEAGLNRVCDLADAWAAGEALPAEAGRAA